MKKYSLQISTIFLISTFIISCGPSMPNKYPNAQVTKTEAGNTLLITEDFSAVILIKDNMEVFPFASPKIQY